VAGLAHDDEFPNAVHCCLRDASGAEGVPAERLNVHSGPRSSTLQELADRIGVQAAPRYMTVSSHGPEDGAIGNPGPVEPLPERADRASILTRSKGQTHLASRALLIRLRFADGHHDAVGGELEVTYIDTRQLRAAKASEREAIERLGSNLGGCLAALEALSGSLVQHTHAEGTAAWKFKHPTVGDAYSGILLDSPELLGIYVHGSPVHKLLQQVTCGDIGLERAVALPKGLFTLVLRRLDEASADKQYKAPWLSQWMGRGRILGFLASRCSREFLQLYLQHDPEVLQKVSEPGMFLHAVSEVDLAIRLHELKLLPEKQRKRFVETVIGYALEGEDLYAIESHRIQSVFTSAELASFHERVRAELVPNLAKVRETWQRNRNSDERPDQHLDPLLDSFSSLKKEFADDPLIVSQIERQIKLGREWYEELLADEPEKERPERTLAAVDPKVTLPPQARVIFDDVDE